MAQIGETLREARMRAKIDISEVEAETKIRAKYLRALENEEWNLLPGSTYVKSFLRTYAECLGLDARLLIEEYKLRYERPSDLELQPIASPLARERRAPVPARIPRGVLVGVALVGLFGALYVLGRSGGDGRQEPLAPQGTATSARERRPAATGTTPAAAPRERPDARVVRLQVVPLAVVNVCLLDARGRRLLNSVNLAPGATPKTYRSKRFRITLGNGSVQLRVNGRVRDVPEVSNGIGYELTPGGRRILAPDARPTCA